MTRKRMSQGRFYVLALVVSVLLAVVSTVLADRFYPSQDEGSLFGVLAFFFLSFCLFIMYDVLSMRFKGDVWAALSGVAVVGLLVTSVAGLHLYFLKQLPLKGFFFSVLTLQSILSLIERWRLDGREPETTAALQSQKRSLIFVECIFILAGSSFLIFWIWPESGWTVLAGLTMALVLLSPLIWGLSLRIRALQAGQMTDSIPPAATK